MEGKKMSEKLKAMILAVDLGNYNIKTSEGIIFPSRFVEDSTGVAPVGEEIISYEGRTFLMEKGTFDFNFNKAKKEYMPNLLYAIAKSCPRAVKSINLVLGVPLDNLILREVFKAELEGKKFDFKYGDTERSILIEKVAVIGEGISSYYTLSPAERMDDAMVIDIGGRTVNVVTYKNKKQDVKFHIGKGTIELYNAIKIKENNEKGENYSVEIIEEYIKKGIIKDSKGIKMQFIKYIMNNIKLEADVRAFNVFFTGGGSLVLSDVLDVTKVYGVKEVKIMKDPLFTNVNGNKKIAEIKWGE